MYCKVIDGKIVEYNRTRKDFGVGEASPESTCNNKGYYKVIDNLPTIDTRLQRIAGSTYVFDATNKVVNKNYTVVDIPLSELQEAKIKEAYDKYLSIRYSDIDYMNTTFQADANSQSLIVSVLSAGSVPDGFYWLDVNNNQVSMTYADLQGLSGAILARGQVAYTDYQAKKAEILATTTVADLDAVVI